MPQPDDQTVIDETRRWILAIVIGLNLCPFARKVFQEGKIRYAVSPARDRKSLLAALRGELTSLAATPATSVETTLLIHPHAMPDFLDFNDFLGDANQLVAELGLVGVIQIASFHPDYRFAGVAPDAVEHYTNRSPYPMLHLLREESISKAADEHQDVEGIPQRNIEMLRALGKEKILVMLKVAADDPV